MSVPAEREEVPPEHQAALRRGIRLEQVSVLWTITSVTLVYFALGSSQAMQTAWAEDLLSFLPPIAFLVATRFTARPPSARHPYGYHRASGVAHLVAATALIFVGAFLFYDAASALLTAEHPPIGTVELLGHTVWHGWVMIAALSYTVVPPIILGRLKMPLARELNDKVLFADADMNKADWMTAVGAMVGILGIGVGLWWADAVAALLICVSILRDGVRNMRGAVADLMDARATTIDGTGPHPLIGQVDEELAALDWVLQARSRVRDLGHVLQTESFVVPRAGSSPTVAELDEARQRVRDLDWKLRDVVVMPVRVLPDHP